MATASTMMMTMTAVPMDATAGRLLGSFALITTSGTLGALATRVATRGSMNVTIFLGAFILGFVCALGFLLYGFTTARTLRNSCA